MSLGRWAEKGWLRGHVASREEIGNLLALIERDLADSAITGLTPDWRLNIAYNAAIQCATTALAASGYRASREAHHVRTIGRENRRSLRNRGARDATIRSGVER